MITIAHPEHSSGELKTNKTKGQVNVQEGNFLLIISLIRLNIQNIAQEKTRAKVALYRSTDYQTFESIGLSVHEKKFNIDFQDGRLLGFQIGRILATFDLRHLDTSNEV